MQNIENGPHVESRCARKIQSFLLLTSFCSKTPVEHHVQTSRSKTVLDQVLIPSAPNASTCSLRQGHHMAWHTRAGHMVVTSVTSVGAEHPPVRVLSLL